MADLPVVSFDGPHAMASGIPADAEVPCANDLASNAREEVVARRPQPLRQRIDEPRWECHVLMMPPPRTGTSSSLICPSDAAVTMTCNAPLAAPVAGGALSLSGTFTTTIMS
jgi:hypothetical protein